MVVLDVSLEMLGEVGDALGEDRYLHLRRAGIARLCSVRLDDFRLAAGRDRHRILLVVVSWAGGSRQASRRIAAGPGCRPARSRQASRALSSARDAVQYRRISSQCQQKCGLNTGILPQALETADKSWLTATGSRTVKMRRGRSSPS